MKETFTNLKTEFPMRRRNFLTKVVTKKVWEETCGVADNVRKE